MNKRMILWLLLGIFFVITAVISTLILFRSTPTLIVSFLNVGQGDAIFIEGPNEVQILIDGGKDRSVLRELTRHMGPLDRSIDLVIATHPDADHIGGLVHVFKHYRVGAYMDAQIESTTNTAQALAEGVLHERGLTQHVALRGQYISLGDDAYLEVLFPDRNVSRLETNTGSVIVRVVYKDTTFLLSGDAPQSIEEWLVALDGGRLRSTVLKVGHHGSRTSSSELWLAAVQPAHVVISAGEPNPYGHPHTEVLERLHAVDAEILSTAQGTVTFVSDGATLKRK